MKANVQINWVPSEQYQDRTKVLKYITKEALVNAVKEAQIALSEYDNESSRPDGSPEMMAKAQLFDEYQRLSALYERVIAGEISKTEKPAPSQKEVSEVKPIYEKTLKVIANGLLNFANGQGVNFMNEVKSVLKEHSKEQLMSEIAPVLNTKFGQGATQILQLLDMAIGDDEGEQFLRNYEKDAQLTKKACKTAPKAKSDKADNSEKETKTESHGNKADAQDRLDRYSKELLEKEALLKADNFSTKDEKKACIKRIASLNRKIKRAENALNSKVEK